MGGNASGKFILERGTVIGFEPAEDNINVSWTKPFNDYRQSLKRLVFPAFIEHIADNLFEDFEVADELSDTVRGEGGFGSTGTK